MIGLAGLMLGLKNPPSRHGGPGNVRTIAVQNIC